MRRVIAVALALLGSAPGLSAQWAVYDPALSAGLNRAEDVMVKINDQLSQTEIITKRIERSLAIFVPFQRYQTTPQPLWRTRWVDPALPLANLARDAFNEGDSSGRLLDQVLPPIRVRLPDTLSPATQRELATYEGYDSAIRSGINSTGSIRGGRKVELAIKAAQQLDLLVPGALGKSLDKMAGAAALALQQGSTRLALDTSIEDQLLMRGKANRDAQADLLEWRVANQSTRPTGALGNLSDLVNALSTR